MAAALAPHRIKFEHECHDVGHLYNLRSCMDIGLFKAPVFIQFIFGIPGGIGPEVDKLVFMTRTADRLFGDDYRWLVLGAGWAQMDGHVRVGMEDTVHRARQAGDQQCRAGAQDQAHCRASGVRGRVAR